MTGDPHHHIAGLVSGAASLPVPIGLTNLASAAPARRGFGLFTLTATAQIPRSTRWASEVSARRPEDSAAFPAPLVSHGHKVDHGCNRAGHSNLPRIQELADLHLASRRRVMSVVQWLDRSDPVQSPSGSLGHLFESAQNWLSEPSRRQRRPNSGARAVASCVDLRTRSQWGPRWTRSGHKTHERHRVWVNGGEFRSVPVVRFPARRTF